MDLSQESVRNAMMRESSFHLLKSSQGSPDRTLQRFRHSGEFSDVSLVSDDGDTFPAHKMVLASHSQKLDRILTQLQPGPLSLFLAGVSSKELSSLLSFIYTGEVRVRQGDLVNLLRAAQTLQIAGLLEDQDVTEDRDEIGRDIAKDHDELVQGVIEDHDEPEQDIKVENEVIDGALVTGQKVPVTKCLKSAEECVEEKTPDDGTEEEEILCWDDPNAVTFEFLKTSKSKLDGILITHDRNYKV